MMATGGGSLGSSLQIAGRAYAGLLEGSLGLAFNDLVSAAIISNLALQLAQTADIETGDAGTAARRIDDLAGNRYTEHHRLCRIP